MLNVCFVSTYPPIHCGIGNYTRSLCQALVETKPVQVTVITERTGKRSDMGKIASFPCFDRGTNYVEDILQCISGTRQDIVHIQHEYSIYGFNEQFLGLLEKIKQNVVVTMHEVHTPTLVEKIDYGLKNLAKNHYELGKLAKKIIVHSETMRKWLVNYGVNSKKVEVVPHGTTLLSEVTATEAKTLLGFSKTDKVILSFGFIRRHKNDCLLIEAFSELLKEVRNARLFLVGSLHPYSSSEDMEELQLHRSTVRRLGLDGYVRNIQRYVDEGELPSVFGCADVLVYLHDRPYVEVSGALHLGIGAGKPIVASAVPRFAEVQQISPETIMHPTDKQRLVDILSRILTDREFAEDLAARTKAYAQKTSWTEVAGEHYRIYQEVVERGA